MLMEKIGKRRAVIIAAILAVLVLAVAGIFYFTRDKSPIPKDISQQLNFVALLPTGEPNVKVDKSTIKYEGTSGSLTFIAKEGSFSITTTEQSTPDSFTDVAQAYGALINSLNGYATFDSVQGTVSLTKPKELKGGQTAVLNSKGVLLFAHPTNGNLNLDQWKQFFNSLAITK